MPRELGRDRPGSRPGQRGPCVSEPSPPVRGPRHRDSRLGDHSVAIPAPAQAPAAWVQARSAGPAVAIRPGDPAPRERPCIDSDSRTCGTIYGVLGGHSEATRPRHWPTAAIPALGARAPAVAIQSGEPLPRRPEWRPADRNVR